MQRSDRSKVLRISCIVVLVSIFVSVCLAELYFSYYGTSTLLTRARIQRADARGIEFDRRSLYQVVRDIRNDPSNRAVPMIGVPQTLASGYGSGIRVGAKTLLPLGGISNRTTVVCNERGEWMSFHSDKRGFNNPSGVWDAIVDIAIIGGGFTLGACVAEPDQWVTRVRAQYPQTVNLGTIGVSLSGFASMQEFLPELQPGVVLWAYYEGTEPLIDEELKSPILLRYLEEESFRQDLTSHQDEIDGILDQIADHRLHEERFSRLVAFAKLSSLRGRFGMVRGGGTPQPASTGTDRIEILKRLLARAQGMVKQWNGVLYFIYLPQSARFLGADTDLPTPIFEANAATLSPHYEDVVTAVRELGIPLIDLVPVFQSTSDPTEHLPLGLPGHYNAEGYRLVADAVLEALRSHE